MAVESTAKLIPRKSLFSNENGLLLYSMQSPAKDVSNSNNRFGVIFSFKKIKLNKNKKSVPVEEAKLALPMVARLYPTNIKYSRSAFKSDATNSHVTFFLKSGIFL